MTRLSARCCILLLGGLIASPLAAEDRRYPLADRGAIVFTVPDDWRDEVRTPVPNLPPTIVFHSPTGPGFQLMVTPIWPLKPDIPRPTVEEAQDSARRAADSVKSQAAEAEIKIEQFKGSETFASYFSVTDRAPKPGEYKYMTQGMMGLDDLRVTFTVLTNDGGEVFVPKALDMLKRARREGGGRNAR